MLTKDNVLVLDEPTTTRLESIVALGDALCGTRVRVRGDARIAISSVRSPRAFLRSRPRAWSTSRALTTSPRGALDRRVEADADPPPDESLVRMT